MRTKTFLMNEMKKTINHNTTQLAKPAINDLFLMDLRRTFKEQNN